MRGLGYRNGAVNMGAWRLWQAVRPARAKKRHNQLKARGDHWQQWQAPPQRGPLMFGFPLSLPVF